MAAENSHKSAGDSLEINLKEVYIGKRRLRYIYQYEPNTVSTNFDKNKKCMPLFLGCDVLDECNSVSVGNLPRFHAKHARKGLATKLNFQPGVRVLGIHGTTRGVWFYSIQGLFKIAFEYYTREEQQHCLRKLQVVWERQMFDPVLMYEINVVLKQGEDESSCGLTLELVDKNIAPTTVLSGVEEFVNYVNKMVDSCHHKNNQSLQHEIRLLKTFLSCIDNKENLDPFLNRTINLVSKCLQYLATVLGNQNSFNSQHVSNFVMPCSDNTTCDSPTQSTEYSTPKQSSNEKLACNNISDSQGFCYKEAVILEVAQWLGTEFLNYQPVINEKVNEFKQRNISSIRNLPSAENLVDEVFPLSMQALLCCWLQVPLARSENRTDTEKSHDRSNLFPVIQLILELANESLVSGVAHVLFSQLVQSDSLQ